jgi:hypothetical protein
MLSASADVDESIDDVAVANVVIASLVVSISVEEPVLATGVVAVVVVVRVRQSALYVSLS